MPELSDEQKYQALLDKSREYDGVFWVAVKTTGIFCRTTCTARKPLRQNVEFFDSCIDALRRGYRPCKICRPLEKANNTPEYISKILTEINTEPFKRIRDYDLRLKGIEPDKIRRWFVKNHKMTFHAYQRLVRLNNAIKMIHSGEKVSSAAFDSGFDSISGFSEAFKAKIGFSPTEVKGKKLITLERIHTPLGDMFGCAVDEGICMLEFTDRRMLETEFMQLTKYLNAVIVPGSHPLLDKLKIQVDEYFNCSRKEFDIQLCAPGTEFQQGVWKILQSIPYGKTRSYKEQAILLGKPEAVRAVAHANGCNRISIIIPCHRVIGENGKLTGYGGGLWRKQRLLDLERGNSGNAQERMM